MRKYDPLYCSVYILVVFRSIILSCVVADDYIFLAHHAGGHDKNDIVYQMRKTFESMNKALATVGASLDDMVQINLGAFYTAQGAVNVTKTVTKAISK